jgi:DNA-binding transcriptional LysR family regulator
MQNLEPILIFITVAEMGSFTHAAESLGIQKGRASTAVRKLEEDVRCLERAPSTQRQIAGSCIFSSSGV